MDERKDMRWHGGSGSRRHAKETAGGYSRGVQVRWDEGSVQLFRPRYGIRSSGSGLRDSRKADILVLVVLSVAWKGSPYKRRKG